MWHSAVMSSRLCSVSVDVDPLRCYFQIHGLGESAAALADVVIRRAVPRFCDLFARHGITATFFVVGSDIATADSFFEPATTGTAAAGRAIFGQAARFGHELGNHSFSHFYDLARRPRAQIEEEIRNCHQALRTLLGRPPVGFRAPGYELSADLLDVLLAFGYRYDSSVFPCPPYYLAKLAVLGKMALQRRHSAAIIGSPRAQLAPTQPYRLDLHRPWQPGQSGLFELPVAVTPWLRLPAIGTSLLGLQRLRRIILRGMAKQRFFNFELHGMDLLDIEEDGLPEVLRVHQRDLRVPLKIRLAALDELLTELCNRSQIVPLCNIAEQLQRSGKLE